MYDFLKFASEKNLGILYTLVVWLGIEHSIQMTSQESQNQELCKLMSTIKLSCNESSYFARYLTKGT